MATGIQNQECVQGNQLRKQLAVAVRSIQWSYAIFWSISTKKQGVLEWTDGYYNGDIKTRKTMQPMELNVDKLGLKRSEQLKELFDCLAIGESNEQAKRPSASLSPEDLSDAEWYYLVCMSFTFAPGTGLPGRAFASGQHIWLCNAQYADSKLFTRSLLAKSASIQTVVCFPMLGGVIELGVTDLVDKAAVLGDTIEYLKDLERRVEELESRGGKKSLDLVVERTSDNYCDKDTNDGKTPINKRKACDIDELDWVSPADDSASTVTVCLDDKEATIEMCVPWRNCLLLEIMDAVNSLQLDAHSVKSSTSDGILSLSLTSKFRGGGIITEGMIKSAIQRVVCTPPATL